MGVVPVVGPYLPPLRPVWCVCRSLDLAPLFSPHHTDAGVSHHDYELIRAPLFPYQFINVPFFSSTAGYRDIYLFSTWTTFVFVLSLLFFSVISSFTGRMTRPLSQLVVVVLTASTPLRPGILVSHRPHFLLFAFWDLRTVMEISPPNRSPSDLFPPPPPFVRLYTELPL